MNKKIVWVVLSCLMVTSLVLASCAPAVVEEEDVVEEEAVVEEDVVEEEAVVEEDVVEEEVEMVLTSLGTWREKPSYGGIIIYPQRRPVHGFDPMRAKGYLSYSLPMVYEELIRQDWVKGPIGENLSDYRLGDWSLANSANILATDWKYEVVDGTGVLTVDIREGVYFHDVPPVSGREMTADDVVYSLRRGWYEPKSRLYTGYPAEEQKPLSIEALDKWTVQIKLNPKYAEQIFRGSLGPTGWYSIVAKEMVEKWGDLTDWRASAGTGPFMLVDYMPGSSLYMERNPNYWREHPLYPGYQMPFPDGIRVLIIEDESTRLAAFRTGKVHFMEEVGWRESDSIMKAVPEVQRAWVPRYAAHWAIFLRNDRPPFDDFRVRLAMWQAIDRQALVDWYGGNAYSYSWPIYPVPQFKPYFRSLEEAPEILREAHRYDPDKARQLLTDAGYPDGFSFTVDVSVIETEGLMPIQAMLAEVGLDMELNVHDTASYYAVWYGREYEHAVYGFAWDMPPFVDGWHSDFGLNYNFFSDPEIDEFIPKVSELWLEPDKQAELIKQVMYDYIAVQLPQVMDVMEKTYIMWWPWVRDYSGEWSIGGGNTWPNFHQYIWLDMEMKKKMGY